MYVYIYIYMCAYICIIYRSVISNSSYFTENISSFLDFHLKPLAEKVKSYIQDTNDFFKKIANLPLFPDDLILCTIDVVSLYPNIPHWKWIFIQIYLIGSGSLSKYTSLEGLITIRKVLDTRKDKTVSTDSLIKLAECDLSLSSSEELQ